MIQGVENAAAKMDRPDFAEWVMYKLGGNKKKRGKLRCNAFMMWDKFHGLTGKK